MNILAEIVEQKKREVALARPRAEAEDWKAKAQSLAIGADFEAALRRPGRMRVIAEIKKASPSAGILRENFDSVEIAKSYFEHGADCLSILTDVHFFQGSVDYLKAVHHAVDLPLLRKDFVIDPVQIYEAKLAGASAVLLIAECLNVSEMKEFVDLIHSLGMTALVELFDPENLKPVIESGTHLIGINNRDLRTFHTDVRHTIDLLADIPNDRVVVSESGIKTRADVEKLSEAGVQAILVGEAFMRAPNPGAKLAELVG
jgi:indole-3-glycerol phosphate synthase